MDFVLHYSTNFNAQVHSVHNKFDQSFIQDMKNFEGGYDSL